MTAATKRNRRPAGTGAADQDEARFIPQDNAPLRELQSNVRRLKWPALQRERYELFDLWHPIAMQILHDAGESFRLLAVLRQVINWSTGEIRNSNADLALRAGNCSAKTISRDVAKYRDLGLIICAKGWRRPGSKILEKRTIKLALPSVLPDGLWLPESLSDGHLLSITNGISRAGHVDTCCPPDMDTRCPSTLEHPKREVSIDAA
jgi:hypothetical protein